MSCPHSALRISRSEDEIAARFEGQLQAGQFQTLIDQIQLRLPQRVSLDFGLVDAIEPGTVEAVSGLLAAARSVGAQLRVVAGSPAVAQLIMLINLAP